MFADGRAVSDGDEVCELGASADACFAHCGAFDGATGAEFDIVVNDHDAVLRNFVMRPGVRRVAESVVPDHGVGVQGDAVTEPAAFIHDNIWIQNAIIADLHVSADVHAGIHDGAPADACAALHDRMGVNDGVLSNVRIGADRCVWRTV